MKQTDAPLHASILAQVAELATQVYFIYEVEAQQLRYLNPAVERLWQLSPQTLLADPERILTMVHPEDQVLLREQYEALLLEAGVPQEGSPEEKAQSIDEKPAPQGAKTLAFRLRLPDDSLKWIQLTAYIIQQGKQAFVSGYAQDITDQKAYLEATLKFNAKKNAILEILSHELAAPFATIQGMTNLLERKLRKGQAVEEFIQHIKDQSMKGSDLIRDFVDAEFLESTHLVLRKERTDLVAIFRTTLEDYQHGGSLIAKQFILSSTTPSIYLAIDSLKFLQVINNLVSNAIKFTPEQGRIEVHIEERQDKATGSPTVLFSVADNGVGIPKEMQPLLFDKFTKARRPGLRGEKTTGLGMSVIKTIVELHQGDIWVESQEGKGTIVYVELPKGQV
jgi:two-component system sensor histidine kinase VicK